MSIPISAAKYAHLQTLATDGGIIGAAAMDQRGSLKKAISKGKGIAPNEVTDDMMSEFKLAVSKVLTPYASAILLDPVWGMPGAEARSSNAGLLLSYEESGYDNTQPGRHCLLLDNFSAKRIGELGANALKILLYYTPFEDSRINDVKHALIERIGDECAANDLPFFLEFVGYDPDGGNEKGIEFASRKPEVVAESMREFSKDRYGVDVLKVEVPVNMAFASGSRACDGPSVYSKREALGHFRAAAEAAGRPFIYLSAGVSNEVFIESLEWAADAGVNFSGVLCGRATWQEAIPIYCTQGVGALEDWLSGQGIKNIGYINERLKQSATPWYRFYGADSAEALVA
jgi:tagatose 1,6-diphosphate aldolase